jgi:phosphoribosylformylglycinamidine cyclo-ligase
VTEPQELTEPSELIGPSELIEPPEETDGAAYRAAGVDYATLDAAKRRALAAAAATTANPELRGATFDPASFGEPASLIRVGGLALGLVLECLGTKSLLAEELLAATGRDRYDAVGYDTVAAAVNDCVSIGALPLVVHAYFATGSAAFYAGSRNASLIAGFGRACTDAGAAWGGGESPTLSGLIEPQGIDLAATALGKVPDGSEPLLGASLTAGDEIVLVASSGLHQNGASLARAVAARLPAGLATPLDDGRLFGEALLDPGLIYVSLVADVLRELPLHYCVHLTGHGFRKLMRADRELSYVLDALPEVPAVLRYLVAKSEMDPSEAYATLNMGAGFALIVGAGAGADVVALATSLGHRALVAGLVRDGSREVVLGPLGVRYDARSLELRAT